VVTSAPRFEFKTFNCYSHLPRILEFKSMTQMQTRSTMPPLPSLRYPCSRLSNPAAEFLALSSDEFLAMEED
jgi:hypothetical protein